MYYNRYKKGFDCGDFEVTKREIIASIAIVAVMIIIGILISGKISEYQIDRNEIYNKAVKIESSDLFQHGMDTNIGNAFVYGELKAVDTVTYPEISGEYMYIEKVKEKYTRHTRTVSYTDSNGKRKTRKETYWTWDRVWSEDKKCNEITFCDIKFDSNKIDLPSTYHIDTIKESSHIRYKYYGIGTDYIGTVFTELKDKTISDNTYFYEDMNIEETVKRLESGGGEIVFWIFWVLLIGICVYGFYYLDNYWLE